MSYGSGDARMVKLAELWERTSAKGRRYFSGFLGDTQVLMFDGGETPHPTKPGETVHVWRLMVQERDPARRLGAGRRATPRQAAYEPRDAWHGHRLPAPANPRPGAPAADDGAFYDDSLASLGRG